MKKKLRSLYTKTLQQATDSARSSLSTSSNQAGQSSESSMYKDCSELPLSVFINCLCTGDITGLITSGTPTQKELSERWFSIYAEYIDLCQQTDVTYSLRLQNDIVALRSKMMSIDLSVRFLTLAMGLEEAKEDSEDVIQSLRNYGFKYSFNALTMENDLKAVVSRSQKWDIQLQMKQAELDSYESAQRGEKPDKVYFTTILIRLSDHAKYMIRPDEITVSEFAIRKRDFVQFINSQNNGRKR
ncbi:hypothetical protein Pan5_13 [Pseudanabaena phage Pan5]|nr:hypothetical protein Pan5_13 [Pseudanabaena phage Pan5]